MEQKRDEFTIILPQGGRGTKEIATLKKRFPKQINRIIAKLKASPTNLQDKNIEKLKIKEFGDYSIRVTRGDRIFYDVDLKSRSVYLLRAGKHDFYKRIS